MPKKTKPKKFEVTVDAAKIEKKAYNDTVMNGSLESNNGSTVDDLDMAFDQFRNYFPAKLAEAFYEVINALNAGMSAAQEDEGNAQDE